MRILRSSTFYESFCNALRHHTRAVAVKNKLTNNCAYPNQSAGDVRNITRFWHPRTGITAFLLHLSRTTELVALNAIPQHDPHPDFQLASHRCSRFPETFLDEFAAVKLFQLRIPAYRMDRCFTPEKSQQ